MPGQGQPLLAITWKMITPCSTMCQVSIHTPTMKNQNTQVGMTAGVMRHSGRIRA